MSDEDAAWYREILKSTDDFYQSKFDNGEVRPGWSSAAWTLERVSGIPRFGSRDCHTALRPLGVLAITGQGLSFSARVFIAIPQRYSRA